MRIAWLFVGGTVACLGTLSAAPEPEKKPADVQFRKDVLPILEVKCFRCHGEKKKDGRLDMRTKESMLKGGVTGPAFAVGKSEKSLMVEMMYHREMPPKKEKDRVSDADLDKIKAWIDAGAPVGKE